MSELLDTPTAMLANTSITAKETHQSNPQHQHQHQHTPQRPKRPWMIPPSPLALPAAVSPTTKCTVTCNCPSSANSGNHNLDVNHNLNHNHNKVRIVTPSILLAGPK